MVFIFNDLYSSNYLHKYMGKSFIFQKELMQYFYNNPMKFDNWLEKSAEPMRIYPLPTKV